MQMKKLDKKVKTIWLIISTIVFLILTAVFGVAVYFLFSEGMMAAAITFGVMWLIISVLLFLYPLLKYKFYEYGYDEKKIMIKRGIIFRHSIVIPVCQLQDLHIFAGPLMLVFKLSGVIFSTAGSNFNLSGLSAQEAKQTVDNLEQFLNKRIEEKRNEEVC